MACCPALFLVVGKFLSCSRSPWWGCQAYRPTITLWGQVHSLQPVRYSVPAHSQTFLGLSYEPLERIFSFFWGCIDWGGPWPFYFLPTQNGARQTVKDQEIKLENTGGSHMNPRNMQYLKLQWHLATLGARRLFPVTCKQVFTDTSPKPRKPCTI